MADGNGESEWREDVQARMERLESAQRDLEDSFIVLAKIETRAAQVLRQHSEWMDRHEKEIAESKARLKHIEIGLAEATDKLNALIDREMRREGGPEIRG
jgi:septal ring factor EnvC (AmiA/AmiB activator)